MTFSNTFSFSAATQYFELLSFQLQLLYPQLSTNLWLYPAPRAWLRLSQNIQRIFIHTYCQSSNSRERLSKGREIKRDEMKQREDKEQAEAVFTISSDFHSPRSPPPLLFSGVRSHARSEHTGDDLPLVIYRRSFRTFYFFSRTRPSIISRRCYTPPPRTG